MGSLKWKIEKLPLSRLLEELQPQKLSDAWTPFLQQAKRRNNAAQFVLLSVSWKVAVNE